MEENKPFERLYSEEHKDNRVRDRFMIEFNDDERELFDEAKLLLMQAKDGTAIKQLAFLGYFAISNHDKFMRYFHTLVLGNFRRNKRIGVNVKTEIETKFQLKKEKLGREMPL